MGLIAGFFVTALLYAAVGFGGGSTYSALLTLSGTGFAVLPQISLACNIVVSGGGTIRFARAGLMPWRGALLLVAVSAPLAFLGGLTPISEAAFKVLLGAGLVAAGLLLFVPLRAGGAANPHAAARWMPLVAAPLGYLAGLVGIGGGIFLAPALHLSRWRKPRQVAASAALFILVNSLTGLAGQIAKGGCERLTAVVPTAWPLLLAVLIGGQIGTTLAQRRLPGGAIRLLTAALTIFAGLRLLGLF